MKRRNLLISFFAATTAIVLGAACVETRGNYPQTSTKTPVRTRSINETAKSVEGQNMGSTSSDNIRGVVVNGERVPDAVLQPLEQYFHVHVPDGKYWYDQFSGAWGIEGGPTLGFTAAGMNIGGALRADASKGDTGVFINGRELHRKDVLSLNLLIAPYRCQTGRYWVDANGNFGVEHGGVMGNLVQIYQAKFGTRGNGGGQHRVYDSGIGAVMGDGSGFIGYISGSSSATSW